MPILFTCACGKRMTVADALAGQPVICPACGQRALPGRSVPARRDSAKPTAVSVSWGPIIKIGSIVVVLALLAAFYFGPVRVHNQTEALDKDMRETISNVLVRGLEFATGSGVFGDPKALRQYTPNVHELNILRPFLVMSLPEEIRFFGSTTEGNFRGTYNTQTNQVTVDSNVGAVSYRGVGAVSKAPRSAHITGTKTNGKLEVTVDGRPVRLPRPQPPRPRRTVKVGTMEVAGTRPWELRLSTCALRFTCPPAWPSEMRYFYTQNRLDQAFGPGVPKFTNIVRPGGCKEFAFVPLGVPTPSPLIVRPDVRRMRAIFTSTTWGFCVAHVDLLDALGDEVRSHLLLGTMNLENDEPVANYRTVRVIQLVVMRDGPRSVHRVCDLCGTLRYTAWPTEPCYIMESSLRSAASIYEIEGESFLVREDVRDRIGNRWSNAIAFHEVPIVAEPRNGQPAELNIQPTPEQLKHYRPNYTPSRYAPRRTP